MFFHPKSVCMTYCEHFVFSMSISFQFAVGAVKSFVHAIYPDLFITSTTDLLRDLQYDISRVGCRKSTTVGTHM